MLFLLLPKKACSWGMGQLKLFFQDSLPVDVKPWKYKAANFQRRHDRPQKLSKCYLSVRLTDPDPLQNGSSTLDHTDRNASGDRPYVNNTPYVITLHLDIQFLKNSQVQLSQQQATQDAPSAAVTLTIPFWLLRHKGSVSSSLLTSPSEWSHAIQEIPSNWQNKEVTRDCTKEKGRLFIWTFWQIRFRMVQARGSHCGGTESRGYLLPADKLRKEHTPEKPKGMQTSQLGVWTVFLKMCFRFTSHNGVSNLLSLLQNLSDTKNLISWIIKGHTWEDLSNNLGGKCAHVKEHCYSTSYEINIHTQRTPPCPVPQAPHSTCSQEGVAFTGSTSLL